MFSKQHYVFSTLTAKCDRARRMVWMEELPVGGYSSNLLLYSVFTPQNTLSQLSCKYCQHNQRNDSHLLFLNEFEQKCFHRNQFPPATPTLHTIKLVSLPSSASSWLLAPLSSVWWIIYTATKPWLCEMLTGTLPSLSPACGMLTPCVPSWSMIGKCSAHSPPQPSHWRNLHFHQKLATPY